jgi:type IV pilus assembly protein PilA
MAPKRQDGFTLIELLVVILIIAILAAIAIPIFLQQRKKGWEAQSQSTLKNAATAAESYATETGGDYSGLDGDDGTILRDEGFKASSGVTISVAAPTSSKYCVTATHSRLEPADAWQIATYNSDGGSPSPNNVDTCP